MEEKTHRIMWGEQSQETSSGLCRNRFLPIKPDFIKSSRWGNFLWQESYSREIQRHRNIQESGRFYDLRQCFNIPLINIIWELLLNNEGKEVYLWNQRNLQARTELGLPVAKLGLGSPEHGISHRGWIDESPPRHWFHETKVEPQGSAVLSNRTGAGAWVFHGVSAWDASDCTLGWVQEHICYVFTRGCAPHALCWPDPGGRFPLFLPPASKTAPHPHHQCLLPSYFSSQLASCHPIACNAILTSHSTPSPELAVQFLQFSSVTSSRKPSPDPSSQSWVRVLLQAVGSLFWASLLASAGFLAISGAHWHVRSTTPVSAFTFTRILPVFLCVLCSLFTKTPVILA